MKSYLTLGAIGAMLSLANSSHAFSGPVFYGDPPDETHPWAVHDQNRPQAKIVTPGTFSTADQVGKAPSDAIVLFDGTEASLSNWQADDGKSATKWIVKDGAMECVPGSGYVRTKQEWGDCQLHVEWAAPTKVEGESQGRGNSGIFLEGYMEIQVLDNYNNPTYADGTAGAIYGINPPMVNPLRPPGQYQVYDIIFRKPVYKDGKCVDPGYATVMINGVLVQDHTPLEGPGGHMGRSHVGPFPEKGPLKLQDHGNPVRYRSVWYRPLPARVSEGGTDGGYLTAETTKAKRAEIAAEVRKDADAMQAGSLQQLRRYAESLVYQNDEATMAKVTEMSAKWVDSLKALPATQIETKKDEVRWMRDAFNYLANKAKVIPADFPAKVYAEQLIKEKNWDKRPAAH